MQAQAIAAGFFFEEDSPAGFFLTSAQNISNSLETLLFLPRGVRLSSIKTTSTVCLENDAFM
jgi:hypothetical protein